LASEAGEVLEQVGDLALGVAAIARDDRQRWEEVSARLRAADLAAALSAHPRADRGNQRDHAARQ
jgi:hypothetical protein